MLHPANRRTCGEGLRSLAVKPTSFDIAQLAGVSQPTVSRALRGSTAVSESTRKRIEAIAQQLNYKVDKNASSLRLRETNTLALLFYEDPLPDSSMINPFFLAMLGSIVRASAQRGYDLLISMQQFSSDWHAEFEESRKADGIILLGHGDFEPYRDKLDSLIASDTHFVRWGHNSDDQLGPVVGSDNHMGGLTATRHLLSLGRRRIAFVGDCSDHYPELRGRYRGYADGLREVGFIADPALQVDANLTEQSGRDGVAALIARGVEFDAIFAASDLIAIGAMRELERIGRSVPHDVAVVGFDDISAASLTRPPLTTIQQDFTRAGEALVAALIDTIRGETVRSIALPTRLIVRQSCGANPA
ncbi:MAG: LacI family DNA-binding transcriptional regulator [Sphingopyxis sp.]|nr:LacI family DNA-binding transcriptional regulator [Sphingopyxis sp.]